MKLFFVCKIVEGKCVVMVDDFIVCGIISCCIVCMFWEVGVIEVYVCISLFFIKNLCFYGIDMLLFFELIVVMCFVEEICELIEVDLFVFLSNEGLVDVIGR